MALSSFCPICGAENEPGDALCHACQQPLAGLSDGVERAYLLNGRYEILTEVGAGGFGAVYKARDIQDADQTSLVAVKQINLKGLAAQEIIEATNAFNREAEILTALSHPLLPRIFDRFSDPEHWYLVMNFIDGQTLDDYLEQSKGGLALSETLAIALQLCEVLDYLHTRQPPVIFRDLKPGNIMRTARGQLYLIDFGIARRFKPGQARDTIPFGSPGFAAPEQYGKAQTTPQADIYSLGALLYCLISGEDPSEHPFHFPRLRVYGVAGLPELDMLIQRMVEPAPEQRPANIQAVRAELQRIQRLHNQTYQKQRIWIPPQGQTPGASATQQHIFQQSSATPPAAPARKTTRRRVLTVGLLAGGVALVGGVVLAANSQGSQSAASQTAQYSATVQTNDATAIVTQDTTQTSDATAIATQNAAFPSDGPAFWSWNMKYAVVDVPYNQQFQIYNLKQQQKPLIVNYQLPQSPSYDFWAQGRWSVDDRTLLLRSHLGCVGAWNTSNGQNLFQLPPIDIVAIAQGVALAPNGQYCAACYNDETNNRNFALIQVKGGKKLFVSRDAIYNSDCVGWSPDSRYLIFASLLNPSNTQNVPWSASIWDSKTLQAVNSFNEWIPLNDASSQNAILAVTWSPSSNRVAFASDNTIWYYDFSSKTSVSFNVDWLSMEIPMYGPVWSPDEKYLATIVRGTLIVLDISHQKKINPAGDSSPYDLISFSWSADSKSITTANSQNVLSHWTVT